MMWPTTKIEVVRDLFPNVVQAFEDFLAQGGECDMEAQPADPGIDREMKVYAKAFHRPFPIDYMQNYSSAEEAIAHIRSFIERGKPVEVSDLGVPLDVAIEWGFNPKRYL